MAEAVRDTSTPLRVLPGPSEQQKQLARVSGSIGSVIVDFFHSQSIGATFFAADLHNYVLERSSTAPASADRVMRDLRKQRVINYTLVSRSQSLYRVESTE